MVDFYFKMEILKSNSYIAYATRRNEREDVEPVEEGEEGGDGSDLLEGEATRPGDQHHALHRRSQGQGDDLHVQVLRARQASQGG